MIFVNHACAYIENENVMSCARDLISFDIIIQLINNYKSYHIAIIYVDRCNLSKLDDISANLICI